MRHGGSSAQPPLIVRTTMGSLVPQEAQVSGISASSAEASTMSATVRRVGPVEFKLLRSSGAIIAFSDLSRGRLFQQAALVWFQFGGLDVLLVPSAPITTPNADPLADAAVWKPVVDHPVTCRGVVSSARASSRTLSQSSRSRAVVGTSM